MATPLACQPLRASAPGPAWQQPHPCPGWNKGWAVAAAHGWHWTARYCQHVSGCRNKSFFKGEKGCLSSPAAPLFLCCCSTLPLAQLCFLLLAQQCLTWEMLLGQPGGWHFLWLPCHDGSVLTSGDCPRYNRTLFRVVYWEKQGSRSYFNHQCCFPFVSPKQKISNCCHSETCWSGLDSTSRGTFLRQECAQQTCKNQLLQLFLEMNWPRISPGLGTLTPNWWEVLLQLADMWTMS